MDFFFEIIFVLPQNSMPSKNARGYQPVKHFRTCESWSNPSRCVVWRRKTCEFQVVGEKYVRLSEFPQKIQQRTFNHYLHHRVLPAYFQFGIHFPNSPIFPSFPRILNVNELERANTWFFAGCWVCAVGRDGSFWQLFSLVFEKCRAFPIPLE